MKENEYKVSGVVEEAKPSISGKTISLKLSGKRYSTKSAVIYQFVGKAIEGVASDQKFDDGSSISWLNEFAAGQGMYQNAPQAPQSAPGAAAPRAATAPPQEAWDHRERSIFIQSLCRHWIAPEDTPAVVREKVQTLFKMVDEIELWAKFS